MEKKCHCPSGNKSSKAKVVLPVIGSLLIALIPKCPFCILAYTTAVTLCSGSKLYQHTPGWTSWISITLALLTLLLVLFNFRGKRTILAGLLILTGGLFIVWAELKTGNIQSYYVGAVILLVGVWVNANFTYFYRRLLRLF